MEVLGRAEVEHKPRNNRMRARGVDDPARRATRLCDAANTPNWGWNTPSDYVGCDRCVGWKTGSSTPP